MAQTVVCTSNLKQWSVLVGFFLDDHDGQFPDADYHDNGTNDDAHGHPEENDEAHREFAIPVNEFLCPHRIFLVFVSNPVSWREVPMRPS